MAGAKTCASTDSTKWSSPFGSNRVKSFRVNPPCRQPKIERRRYKSISLRKIWKTIWFKWSRSEGSELSRAIVVWKIFTSFWCMQIGTCRPTNTRIFNEISLETLSKHISFAQKRYLIYNRSRWTTKYVHWFESKPFLVDSKQFRDGRKIVGVDPKYVI